MPAVLTPSEKRGMQRRAGAALAPYIVSGVIGFLVHLVLRGHTPAAAGLGLLVAIVVAGLWPINWDRDDAPAPHPNVIRGRETQTIVGLVLVAVGYPVGWTVSIGLGAAVVLIASVGLALAMGRRHQRLQPTATWFGVLADAFARVPRKARTLAVTGAAGLAGLLATLGVPLLAVPVGLLMLLAVTRLSWPSAQRDGRTRLAVHVAGAGWLSGGAWDALHQAARRMPLLRLDLNDDGLPQTIVLPLPERLTSAQRDAAELEIADRFDRWGTYAVRWDTTERNVTVNLVPPLTTMCRYDGRSAIDGTRVWCGVGRATKAHAHATATGGAQVGDTFDVYWDLRTEPHGLLVGTTGSGKSQTLALIVTQLALAGWRICAVDPKRVEFSAWVGRPGILKVTTELVDHVELLEDLVAEMTRRYQELTEAGVNHIDKLPAGVRPRRLLAVVDEVVELLALPRLRTTDEAKEIVELKGRASVAIGSILRLGRAAGVHLLLAAQRADRTVVDGEYQNNLALKIIHGVPETIERTMVGLDDTQATPGIAGRAVGRTISLPWTELQVAYVDIDTDLDRYLPVGGVQPEPVQPEHPSLAPAAWSDRDAYDAPLEEAAEEVLAYADVVEATGGEASTGAAEDARAREDQAAQPSADQEAHQPRHTGRRIEPLPRGEARARLEALIGLEATKAQVRALEARVAMAKRRAEAGLGDGTVTPGNLVFTGPPGVGKTEVAVIIASLLRDLGMPDFDGHVIVCTPANLRGSYVGHSGSMTRSALAEAEGGVLVIDEAYGLVGDGFTGEVLTELLAWTDGSHPRLVVVLAGYKNEMDTLLDANPGLRSRFETRIEFLPYSVDELVAIAQVVADRMRLRLAAGAVHALRGVIDATDREDREWANARSVRNLVNRAATRLDERLHATEGPVTDDDLVTITAADIAAPVSTSVDNLEARQTAEEWAAKEWIAKHSGKRSA
jgi:hypothetical protein